MRFVTFHAAPGSGEIAHGAHPGVKIACDRYAQMIDMLFRSARHFHPGSSCSVITTADTDLSPISVPFSRVDADIDFSALMFERTRAQLSFLEASDGEETVIFLDSDILINGDLGPAVAMDFDIGLTWRPSSTVPINGGIIIVRGGRAQTGLAFFRRLLERFRDAYGDERRWFGDQQALKDLVPTEGASLRLPRLVRSETGMIGLLPCEIYNYAPLTLEDLVPGRLAEPVIWHFKGARKKLMPIFWQWQMAPRLHRGGAPGSRSQ